MAKVEQDIEVEIDIPKSLKFKKTIGKIKYKLHEEEVKLIIDIKKIAKEIERLQEQLNEANEVVKTTHRVSGNIDLSQMVYEDRRKIDGITMQTGSYLEKWGIK